MSYITFCCKIFSCDSIVNGPLPHSYDPLISTHADFVQLYITFPVSVENSFES